MFAQQGSNARREPVREREPTTTRSLNNARSTNNLWRGQEKQSLDDDGEEDEDEHSSVCMLYVHEFYLRSFLTSDQATPDEFEGESRV